MWIETWHRNCCTTHSPDQTSRISRTRVCTWTDFATCDNLLRVDCAGNRGVLFKHRIQTTLHLDWYIRQGKMPKNEACQDRNIQSKQRGQCLDKTIHSNKKTHFIHANFRFKILKISLFSILTCNVRVVQVIYPDELLQVGPSVIKRRSTSLQGLLTSETRQTTIFLRKHWIWSDASFKKNGETLPRRRKWLPDFPARSFVDGVLVSPKSIFPHSQYCSWCGIAEFESSEWNLEITYLDNIWFSKTERTLYRPFIFSRLWSKLGHV